MTFRCQSHVTCYGKVSLCKASPNLLHRLKSAWRAIASGAGGLRPVQIWVPDTRSPDFVEICHRQARAVAASDPAGDELMRFVADCRNGRNPDAAWPIRDCATPGDYGKPRPALIVQSDLFAELPSVVICPLTTTLRTDADLFRLDVEPSAVNGLRQVSQMAIDKITVIPMGKIGGVIGQADDALLLRVNRALALFLSIV